jgi:hypothetical protein
LSSLLRVEITEVFENTFLSGLSSRSPLISREFAIVRRKRFINRNTVAREIADRVGVEGLRVRESGEEAAEYGGKGAAVGLGGDREHFGGR